MSFKVRQLCLSDDLMFAQYFIGISRFETDLMAK
jgi:hypothetical protein